MKGYKHKPKCKVGDVFGMLTITKKNIVYGISKTGWPFRRYHVDYLCKCGNAGSVVFDVIRRGSIKSCGCLSVKPKKPMRVKRIKNRVSISRLSAKRMDAFWGRVNINNDHDRCWEWRGGLDKCGYGKLAVRGSSLMAHRVAYYLHHSIDPGELQVCHKCDNPICCNPNHLFLGTQKDNMKDKGDKNRVVNPEKHRSAKLTWVKVDSIREEYANGTITQKELAKKYCVREGTILGIIKHRYWHPKKHP